MRGHPRESLKTSSNKLWSMLEEHLAAHPELDLEVGLEVLTYSNVGSFNNARVKRPNLSTAKRKALLQYIGRFHLGRDKDRPGFDEVTVADIMDEQTDRHEPIRPPRHSTAEAAMANVGAALALLREAMTDLAAHYPQPLWNRNMRELSVLSGQLLKNFPHQGGLRASADK